MPHGLIFAVFLLFLNSCALLHPSDAIEPLSIIPMAPPIGPTRRIVQKITALWPGRRENMLCVLEMDKLHIAIAGLSSDGMSLFNLSYDGKNLLMDKSPLLPPGFSPEYIIKDIQMVYWPLAELQKLLPEKWSLESDSHHRRLYFNHKLQFNVDYSQPDDIWPKLATLTNYRYHYTLHINTISYDTVSQ